MGKLINGKYQNNTLLIQSDGEDEIAIDDYRGLVFLDLNINSPQPQSNLINTVGLDGSQQQGPVLYGPRMATVNFYLDTDDGAALDAKTHEIWSLFYRRGLIRLRQTDTPGICVYGIAQPYEVTHISRYEHSFSIQFNIPSGFRYSTLRSTELSTKINNYSNIGMNLPFESLNYTQKNGDFEIYNPSDIDIQPYEQSHDLNLIFKGLGSPTLKNLDTGDKFSCFRNLSVADDLVVKGIHPTINGQPCEINTNHGDIQLAKRSWNHFSLTGFTGTVTFDFPFIYL